MCSGEYEVVVLDEINVALFFGLITVAALLPEQFQIRLVDLNVDALGDDDLAWADMAFISAMAVQRESAVHVVNRCKAKGLKIVAGGPLFTAQPYEFEQVDHLVLDEAEATLPAFLTDLKNGCPKQLYRAKEYPDIVKTIRETHRSVIDHLFCDRQRKFCYSFRMAVRIAVLCFYGRA